jgi:long-chain fatty acid transport protein
MRRKSGFGVLLLATVLVVAAAQQSFGAGFALFEGSARGNALGGAMVGRADDPSALFYNPAGITQLPGLQFMAGTTFVIPSTTVETFQGGVKTSTDTEDNVWIPPHVYATYQFNDSLWFGLGIYSPFGLGTEFPDTWPGRYNSYKAVIETLSINPNVAYKITDQLSVAAGMTAMWFDLTLDKKINPGSILGIPTPQALDIDSHLTGDTWGYGFNFALHYEPFNWMSLGFAYRSEVKQNVNGTADFTKPARTPVPATWFNDTDASGSIKLPAEIFLGAAFMPCKNVTWEVGGVLTMWSSFRDLTVNFDNPIIVLPSPLPSVTQQRSPKEWNDEWRFNTGIEYKALDWLDLRIGYVFDMEPTRSAFADYLVPANDRHLFSGGTGFHWNKWTLDLSYTYLLIEDRDVFNSTAGGVLPSKFRDGDAHLVGISLSYKL